MGLGAVERVGLPGRGRAARAASTLRPPGARCPPGHDHRKKTSAVGWNMVVGHEEKRAALVRGGHPLASQKSESQIATGSRSLPP